MNLNPYQRYGRVEPVVGAVLPAPGSYDFVFDTPAGARPGKFTFRVWVNDVTPPSVPYSSSGASKMPIPRWRQSSLSIPSSEGAIAHERYATFTFRRGS